MASLGDIHNPQPTTHNPQDIMNEYPDHFAEFADGRLWTAWKMFDGCTMAGSLVTPTMDAYTVLRVDGTTCHVPTRECHPASPDDVTRACRFYETTPLGTDPVCQLPLVSTGRSLEEYARAQREIGEEFDLAESQERFQDRDTAENAMTALVRACDSEHGQNSLLAYQLSH